MKFKLTIFDYLIGKKFNSGLIFNISTQNNLSNRIDFLVKILKNKKIIHIGCVDHVNLIEQKIKNNTWLFGEIVKVAKKQIGIDINRSGIKYVNKLGFKNIIYENIESNNKVNKIISDDNFDVILLGEMLEHIDNPINFLTKVHKKYHYYVDELIITVPNGFSIDNFFQTLRGNEFINSDHRYWFTLYTILKVLVKSGFKPKNYYFVGQYSGKMDRTVNYFLRRFSQFRNTIIVTAKFN